MAYHNNQYPSVKDGAPRMSNEAYWTDAKARSKARAKAVAEILTFPVLVCDKDGAVIQRCSCFALYSYQDGHLGTSRSVAEAQRSGPEGSQVRVKITGDWLPCEVLRPSGTTDILGRQFNLAVLKLEGDKVAPAGKSLGPVNDGQGFIVCGISHARGKAPKFHLVESSAMHRLSLTEIAVTAPSDDSWIGGPVLDLHGYVVGVITGKRDDGIVFTTTQHMIFYSASLGLTMPAYPGSRGPQLN